LTAIVYVDDLGSSAEGEGTLIRLNQEEISGSVKLFVEEID
jgi:hypothetical protein